MGSASHLLLKVATFGEAVADKAQPDRDAKALLDDTFANAGALCGAVRKLAKQLEDAMKQKDRDTVSKLSAASVAAGKKRKVSAGANLKFFSLDFAVGNQHQGITTFNADSKQPTSALMYPFIIEQSESAKEVFRDPVVRLNHLVFRAAFFKYKVLNRDMKNKNAADQARKKLLESVLEPEALATFVGDSVPKLLETHVFGYKGESNFYGPEVFGVGGLRVIDEKSGSMMVVAFSSICSHSGCSYGR